MQKLKVSPSQAMKAYEDVDARIHIYTVTVLGWGRVASPTPGRFHPRGKPRYSFYRRLSEPQDQSGTKGLKKKFHPSDTGDQTRTVQRVGSALQLELTGMLFLQCLNVLLNLQFLIVTLKTLRKTTRIPLKVLKSCFCERFLFVWISVGCHLNQQIFICKSKNWCFVVYYKI